MSWWWSWTLTLTGVTTFFLAGKKVWWAWYVGLVVNQPIWLIYGLVTKQWGFIASTLFYTVVYGRNAVVWTRERNKVQDEPAEQLVHTFALYEGHTACTRSVQSSAPFLIAPGWRNDAVITCPDCREEFGLDRRRGNA